jgi:hypothetical protein
VAATKKIVYKAKIIPHGIFSDSFVCGVFYVDVDGVCI